MESLKKGKEIPAMQNRTVSILIGLPALVIDGLLVAMEVILWVE